MDGLKTAVILSAFLALGLAYPSEGDLTQAKTTTLCTERNTTKVKAAGGEEPVDIMQPVLKCTCQISGERRTYADNTDCLVKHPGHDNENTHKAGKCQNGACIVTPIRRGCKDKQKPQTPVDTAPQIGCTFTCFNDENEREYDYYPEDTACRHYKTDGTLITTTCKKAGFQGQTVCRAEAPQLPAC